MDLTRRHLLGSFGILAAARGLTAQAKKSSIRVKALNHMTLTVADPHRSQEFYQGLFGLPVQARQGATTILRIGPGPQFVALSKGRANAKPGIAHFCMTVDNFDIEQILKILTEYGVTRTDTAGTGPMKAWVRKREEGTAELYLTDPDGITVQLQDASYCGGTGVLGNVCLAKPEPAPAKGLIAARDFSHFTLMVADPQRSRDFYAGLFGLHIQAYQGSMPVLGIGARSQFLALAGGAAAAGGLPPRRAAAGAAGGRPAGALHGLSVHPQRRGRDQHHQHAEVPRVLDARHPAAARPSRRHSHAGQWSRTPLAY